MGIQQATKGCPKYECGNPNGNTCGSTSAGSNTIKVVPCDTSNSDYAYCPAGQTTNVDQTFECTKVPQTPLANLNIMDLCATDAQCKGRLTCEDGACVGYDEGDDCQYDYECNPGTYCKATTFKCAQQIAIGKTGCESDYDCVNNAVCKYGGGSRPDGSDLLNGTCTLFHSLPTGADPGHCGKIINGEWSYYSSTCAGLSCAVVDVMQDVFICLDTWTTKNSGPCTLNSACQGVSTFKGKTYSYSRYGQCTCGANTDGNAYCRQHLGDPVSKPILDGIDKTRDSPKFLNVCNTAARFGLNCKRRVLSNDDFNVFLTAVLYERHFANIYKSEDCLIQVYAPQYWFYNQDPDPPAPPTPPGPHPEPFDDYDDDDWAMIISFLSLFYLI